MSTRKDICVARTNGEKTFWSKIGTAWFNDKGGISLEFDALPIPQLDAKTGQIRTRAVLFDPKPKAGGGSFNDGNMGDEEIAPF